jgi:hypothetical protein
MSSDEVPTKKAAPSHPKYVDMIIHVIKNCENTRAGVSR